MKISINLQSSVSVSLNFKYWTSIMKFHLFVIETILLRLKMKKKIYHDSHNITRNPSLTLKIEKKI